MEFKIGDWVFSEYELKQITEIEGDQVTGVTCGLFSHHGSSLNYCIFPLEISIKRISNEYEHWEKKVRENEGRLHLNWPDLHRWFVDHWAGTCLVRDDDEKVKERYVRLREFCHAVIDKCLQEKTVEVDGIALFRK